MNKIKIQASSVGIPKHIVECAGIEELLGPSEIRDEPSAKEIVEGIMALGQSLPKLTREEAEKAIEIIEKIAGIKRIDGDKSQAE